MPHPRVPFNARALNYKLRGGLSGGPSAAARTAIRLEMIGYGHSGMGIVDGALRFKPITEFLRYPALHFMVTLFALWNIIFVDNFLRFDDSPLIGATRFSAQWFEKSHDIRWLLAANPL